MRHGKAFRLGYVFLGCSADGLRVSSLPRPALHSGAWVAVCDPCAQDLQRQSQ